MEVADQWRRQWAGTAEYGKVTEGGVTRRVARAMEVLHASGPGARVRVMRASYHSSAGPGAPAESFMLHSSRRVISSGFNFLENPSLPIKPLEISSTPLEPIHDSNGETENYKVTEPDDLEISEPSKWRGSTKVSSIRMPSEESSSTDNASIIDLDSRNNKNLHRKHSYDSESSDIQYRSRSSSRNSQILDAPTTLSTLKFKSLLTSSDAWNTRRKSYSFEDSSPLNETVFHNNATLAMESSTDSGICKSTEIVNDHIDDNSHLNHYGYDEKKGSDKEESFRDWLTKNRPTSQYNGTKFKTHREHDIVIEDPKENNIALQSYGKLSITLPITVKGDHDINSKKILLSEDGDKRVKKVEFCKTEVHFAADSGKVNIIATDEKPPPSNDFRKRRSAFVPMQVMTDRPITLFGEKHELPLSNEISTILNHSNSDYTESDENTAATKSILKNKIPKPKPYLLGENMDFGIPIEVDSTNKSVPTGVSLVNQQIESEKLYKDENNSILFKEVRKNNINNNIFRTSNPGSTKNDSLKHEKPLVTNIKIVKAKDDRSEETKNKNSSPTQVKPKTRQLRESDLTYFGIHKDREIHAHRTSLVESEFTSDNILENIFQSVKLIQQVSNSVSNSVCNSEPESEDGPEYQNIPLNFNYAPVPTPRLHSKYGEKPNEIAVVRAGLKPIIEKDGDEIKDNVRPSTRRTKFRSQEEVKVSRSLSEPPKNFKRNSQEHPLGCRGRRGINVRPDKDELIEEKLLDNYVTNTEASENNIPIYANLNINITNMNISSAEKRSKTSSTLRLKETQKISSNKRKNANDSTSNKTHPKHDSGKDSSLRKKHSMNKDTVSSSLKREAVRSEKSYKYTQYNDTPRTVNEELSENKNVKSRENNHKSEEYHKLERNNRLSQKTSSRTTSDESKDWNNDHTIMQRSTSNQRKRNTSEDKISSLRGNVKPSQKCDSDSTERYQAHIRSNEREKEYGSKQHHRRNKHREYVINYDDKNGTVSSVCKVKTGLGTPRQKKTSKEVLEENHKDKSLTSRNVDKIVLRK